MATKITPVSAQNWYFFTAVFRAFLSMMDSFGQCRLFADRYVAGLAFLFAGSTFLEPFGQRCFLPAELNGESKFADRGIVLDFGLRGRVFFLFRVLPVSESRTLSRLGLVTRPVAADEPRVLDRFRLFVSR